MSILEKRLEKTNAFVTSQYVDSKISNPIYISSRVYLVSLLLAFETALGRLSSGYTPSRPLSRENVAHAIVRHYGGWLVHKLPEAKWRPYHAREISQVHAARKEAFNTNAYHFLHMNI